MLSPNNLCAQRKIANDFTDIKYMRNDMLQKMSKKDVKYNKILMHAFSNLQRQIKCVKICHKHNWLKESSLIFVQVHSMHKT